MSQTTHSNAPLTPGGRLRMVLLVVDGRWAQCRVADRFQVHRSTVSKWVRRYRVDGLVGLEDRSSIPVRSPKRLAVKTERRIIAVRFNRRWGAHRIAHYLHLAQSTVSKVLARFNMPRLAHVDRATGLAVRKPKVVRYEHDHPGDLVHLDVKKLGKIPDGGGWRTHGRGSPTAKKAATTGTRGGYAYLHTAIDDHSRLVYSEILPDETKGTTTRFYWRARAYYKSVGITIKWILTDNGSPYRSRLFNAALKPLVKHQYTKPYRPQTNGKVERFYRTLTDEWAYARPYTSETERTDSYQEWIHHYNHHRPHFGIGGTTPSDRVDNLRGNNI